MTPWGGHAIWKFSGAPAQQFDSKQLIDDLNRQPFGLVLRFVGCDGCRDATFRHTLRLRLLLNGVAVRGSRVCWSVDLVDDMRPGQNVAHHPPLGIDHSRSLG